MDISTGFNGFTIDVFDGSTSDSEGDVTKAIFAITFPKRVNETNVVLSNNAKDWSCLTPMNDYIELYNPKTLFTTPSSAIVKFDMREKFPSNSQVILCKHNASASYTITDTTETATFKPDTIEAVMGFTSNEYGGTTNIEGETNRVIFNIPFTLGINDVNFEISEGANDWGALMGDGSIININNPYVLFQTKSNATVSFAMEKMYPSNSPCILIKRREAAKWTITPRDEEHPFIPVTLIVGPSFIPMGERVNLYSQVVVYPMNSSSRNITWKIIDAGATGAELSNKNWLTTKKAGTLKIEATIEDGLGKGKNFTKVLTINIVDNWITIDKQPILDDVVLCGQINEFLAVTASTEFGNLEYQWYQSTDGTNTAGIPMPNGDSSIFYIPKNLIPGEYYYFCEIRKENFPSVRTEVAHIKVRDSINKVNIFPSNVTNVLPGTKVQFSCSIEPPTADEGQKPQWYSSDTTIVTIDEYGMATFNNSGSASISCKIGTIMSSIIVTSRFIPVTNIDGVPSTMTEGGEFNLNSVLVSPTNATNKTIKWSLINGGTTGATLTGNILNINKSGTLVIRAIIENGSSPALNYSKDFSIKVEEGFIPVTDIIVTNDKSELLNEYSCGSIISLNGEVVPINATNQHILFEIENSGTTNANITDNLLTLPNIGTCSIIAKVPYGSKDNKDFIKKIEIKVNNSINIENINISPDVYNPGDIFNTDAKYNVVGPEVNLKYTVQPEDFIYNDNDISLSLIDDNYPIDIIFNSNTNILQVDYTKFNEDVDNFSIKINAKFNKNNEEKNFINYININVPKLSNKSKNVEDISINKSAISPIRAFYPLDISNYTVTSEFKVDPIINVFEPENYIKESYYFGNLKDNKELLDILNNLEINDVFNYNEIDEKVLMAFEQCQLGVEYRVTDGKKINNKGDVEDYVKTYVLNINPPFIPVKDIIDIPSSIPIGKYILTPHIIPENINYYNDIWNTESPSYNDIKWHIVNTKENTAEATIDENGIITTNKIGSFTIQASIDNGLRERIQWKGKIYDPIPFIKEFTIESIAKSKSYYAPIITINKGLDNEINIYSLDELNLLSNHLIGNELNFENGLINKNDINTIDFIDHNVSENLIFKYNDIIEINGIPNSVLELTNLISNEIIEYDLDNNGLYELLFNEIGKYKIKFDTNIGIVEKYLYIVDDIISSLSEFNINNTLGTPISIESDKDKFIIYKNDKESYNTFNNFNIDSEVDEGQYESWLLKKNPYEIPYEGIWDISYTSDTDSIVNNISIAFFNDISSLNQNINLPLPPVIRSLKNFGANCYNLKSINKIPQTINGDGCFKNFLMNAILFNSDIILPEKIDGEFSLYKFLQCNVSFNSNIKLPVEITGRSCMENFMIGCLSYNKSIILPNTVLGDRCLCMAFASCESLNNKILMPEIIHGNECLRFFLKNAFSFNQDIELPDNIGISQTNSNYINNSEHNENCSPNIMNEIFNIDQKALFGFMYNARDMTSKVFVPTNTGINTILYPYTFSMDKLDCDAILEGIKMDGRGAAPLVSTGYNTFERFPYRHFKIIYGLNN